MKMIRVNGNYKINALKMMLTPAAIAVVLAGSTIWGRLITPICVVFCGF